MGDPLRHRSLQMRNALRGGGSHCWWHRGEDEAWSGRADRVADAGIGRDVPSHNAKAFGQGPFDNVDAVHDAILLGDAGVAGSVKTDGKNLVKISEGPEFRREIADTPDRGDVAIIE
jgi:hypothetical protein